MLVRVDEETTLPEHKELKESELLVEALEFVNEVLFRDGRVVKQPSLGRVMMASRAINCEHTVMKELNGMAIDYVR